VAIAGDCKSSAFGHRQFESDRPHFLFELFPMSKVQFSRGLKDLVGVGKACLGDFQLLKITSVEELAKQDPEWLYSKLCALSGKKHCICVKDVLYCTVAQARSPELSYDLCQWFTWSRLRKEGKMQSTLKTISQNNPLNNFKTVQ
jgi:hypothetical protein